MPYDNIIDRSGAAGLMPEEYSLKLLKEVKDASLVLTAFEDVPMARGQDRMPVLSALPVAYFVGADTGLAQTTQADWENKYMNAETLMTFVPIPEAVVEDADNIWKQIEPLLKKAMARTLDGAVLFNMGKPQTWPEGLAAAAKAAGNEVKIGTTPQDEGGLGGDVVSLIGKIEEDGFDFNYAAAQIGLKSKIRNARDTLGEPLADFRGSDGQSLYAQDLVFPARGLWPKGSGEAQAILFEREQFIVGMRTDIELKMMDQAVITDSEGKVILNLPQQDSVAMRVRFRCGYQVSNQVTYDQPEEADRYPAGVLTHE